jgi:hypothetical protein
MKRIYGYLTFLLLFSALFWFPNIALSAAMSSTPSPKPGRTSTPTPKNPIFRDDFTVTLAPDWKWENEVKGKWTITKDGWLQIIGEDSSLINNGFQNNMLCRPLPEGDFSISAHLITKPNANFQQVAIFLVKDGNNFVAVNRGFCDLCLPGGNGIFMDYKINGKWGSYKQAIKETDVYLKLENKKGVITGYYALTPDKWKRAGMFGNYIKFKEICLGVTNCKDVNSDVVGLYDYFEIAKP